MIISCCLDKQGIPHTDRKPKLAAMAGLTTLSTSDSGSKTTDNNCNALFSGSFDIEESWAQMEKCN